MDYLVVNMKKVEELGIGPPPYMSGKPPESDYWGPQTTIEELEETVIWQISTALASRIAGDWCADDDDIFAYHTGYVDLALGTGLYSRPVTLWEHRIAPEVEQADAKIQSSGCGNAIHKGAPLYNVGLCCFIAGDFDRASQYLAEAGLQDERLGRGPKAQVSLGDGLSEGIIFDPMLNQLVPRNVADYQACTGITLDAIELRRLLTWLATRLSDALQVVTATHRFIRSQTKPYNHLAQHLSIQALADLLVSIESSLRRWQGPGVGELYKRMESLVASSSQALAFFRQLHNDYNSNWPKADRETHQAVNWLVVEAIHRIDTATTTSARAGVVSYLAVRLRNSLMHVIEEQLSLRTDQSTLQRVFGLMFAVLRLSQHGEAGSIGSL